MADISVKPNYLRNGRSILKRQGLTTRVLIIILTGLFLFLPAPNQDQSAVFAEGLPAPNRLGDNSPSQIISAGGLHTCGIQADGSVICWGHSSHGQLEVPSPNANFLQISSGDHHTCGLKNDSSIVCWGNNSYGQLNVPAPNQDFMQVSANKTHTCGLKNDGSIVCWGDNSLGYLNVPAPNQDFSQVSAGFAHICGRKSDESIVCWGLNHVGQTSIPSPNTDFLQVSAGVQHTCGLKNDGSIVCWGENSSGQSNVPAPNQDFIQVSAGSWHTCGLKNDGGIVCWGSSSSYTGLPPGNTGFAQISAGGFHTCGIKSDGSFACWGDDSYGQTQPNQFIDISAGAYHTCGISKSNTIICWGQDDYNGLVVPTPNTDFVDVSAGWNRTCGLKSGGSIVCWGGPPYINYGTVPTPNTGYSDLSVGTRHACAVKGTDLYCWPENTYVWAPPSPSAGYLLNSAGDDVTCGTTISFTVNCWGLSNPSPNFGLYYISAGSDHACAINSDNSIQCWGSNAFGKTTVPSPNSNFVQEISVGIDHSCSKKASNSVVCWGSNGYGQSSVPFPNNYIQMDAGYYHTCALRPDGTPVCWGRNNDGQTDLPFPTHLKVPPSIHPPTAVDDSYSPLEDTPLAVNAASGVLANDIDLDGPSLTAHKDSDPSQGTAALALDGSFLYTPALNSCGPDSFTYHAEDGTFSSNIATVNLAITCVNDPPSFSASNPPTVLEDSPLQIIPNWASFTSPGPPDEAGQSVLSYIVSNISDPTFFSQAPVVSTAGTLTYQTAPDRYGSVTFDLQVQDDGGTANGGVDSSPAQNLTITVTPVNDQPDFSASDPPAVTEDAGLQIIPNWAAFDPGPNEAGQSVLAYSISNISNPVLFGQNPAVSGAGTLSYRSALHQNGSSTFDIQVQDDGGTANGGVDTGPIHTFTIQVNPDNDPPTTFGLGVFSIVEDTPGNLLDIWPDFDDLEDTDLQLSFSLESHSNPGLFTLIDIYQDQYLRMVYTPDEFGSSTITVRATDTGGLFVDGDLALTLRPVNDAPSFSPGGNISVPMNSGPYSAPWAGGISSGPSNESGQNLSFSISNNNNGLFSSQPDLSLAGVLSFTPAPNVTGSAQVSVTLSDDGGIVDGGVDTSPTEIFMISVGPFPTVVQVWAEGGPGIIPGSTVVDWIDDFSIQFDMPMDNHPGSIDPDDVTNSNNYLLVHEGSNGILETASCIGAPGGDDRLITINWVGYPYAGNTARIFVNGGISLPDGEYRIFACGSTSLTAGGVALGGDGVNPGTDYSLDFYVNRPDRLPETGFPPGKVTFLEPEDHFDLKANSTGLTLEIPGLDLSAPIIGIPIQENNWNVSWLSNQVGWLEGTAFPTWAGNSALTGHIVNASGLPGPFARLRELRYGDQITIRGWDQTYIYEVRSVKIHLPGDLSSVLGHEEYPWISLITCSGYQPWQESYANRIVIKAVQVGIK